MKNNMLKISFILIFLFFSFNVNSADQFNFDVTEVEITDDGNKFIGKKRGKITTNEGIIIQANEFEYNKKLNILNATGEITINDTINNILINSDEIKFDKNINTVYSKKNSRAVNLNDEIEIIAEKFEYSINEDKILAEENVILEDKKKDYIIQSDFILYTRKSEKIFSKGKTTAIILSKYNLQSEDVTFFKNSNQISSSKKTIIKDKTNLYSLEKFIYFIEKEELKGEKILINSNYNLPKSDKFYFSNAIINLKNQNFIAKDTKIRIHKNIFDNSDNDPRLIGVSSSRVGNITTVNKSIFTSCKQTDNCPPWSIQANKIIHDRDKKQINYKNALLKIYDIPILYFPKFFHPDPTVKRQSGILIPTLNSSNVLGSSFNLPYYHVISYDSDITITPSLFDSGSTMIQSEYRKVKENSEFIIDFGFVNNFKSSIENNKNSIFNLFSKYNLDLDLEEFSTSELFLNIQKVTNDTFLKVFDTNIDIENTSLKPNDFNNLKSEVKLTLVNENYNLESGIISYENLQKKNNDRYEYILPYYYYYTNLSDDLFGGTLNLFSNGSNNYNNTNQLKTNITNDISFVSKKLFKEFSLDSNFTIDLKNLNSIGKNHSNYKSSPQVEVMSLFSFKSNLPLQKKDSNYNNFLTPKLSLNINPSDMKNYSTEDKIINTDNIFNNNRLGLSDSLEAGRSLTLGIDYRKEKLNDINKFFEFEIATVLRDKAEDFIPKKTTLNKKHSNIFGSISSNFSENLNLKYKFAIENDFNTFEYNDLNTELIFGNFTTEFNFVEENGVMGNTNYIENITSLNLDNSNYLTFNTRRNRKLNLTEYYDLVYEYKNDCLTAGIKYKKTYYEDRELKPSENLFFTLSIVPITSYEQKIDR